jgi:Tfp pilus assembly protein PilO
MKQESKRLSSIIIAALIIAAALVVYFDLIVPTYTNLESIKGEVESETAAYTNQTQMVSEVKSLLTTYQNDASSSQAVAMALPVGEDLSGALAQVYGIASNTGVTVTATGISAQAVQAVAPSSVGGGAAGSIVKPTGTISFQVSGAGSYESIKNFLTGLATNIRIFNVTAISLSPSPVAGTKTQAGNPDMFNYIITVVTYYQAP